MVSFLPTYLGRLDEIRRLAPAAPDDCLALHSLTPLHARQENAGPSVERRRERCPVLFVCVSVFGFVVLRPPACPLSSWPSAAVGLST